MNTKEKIELKDLLDLNFLSNLKASPDELHLAYIRSQCDEEHNDYRSYVHISDGTDSFQLTGTGKDSMYLWDDDKTILFANMREDSDREAVKKGEERTVFYRISINGGEAHRAFAIPLNVTEIKKVKAHLYAFTADYHLLYSHMYILSEEERNKVIKERQDLQDYEILDELPFYGNGAGYTNKKRNILFLYDETTNKIERVSDELCNVYDFELNDDHNTIVYTGEAYRVKPIYKESVIRYDIMNHSNEELLPAKDYSIHAMKLHKNSVLLCASDQKSYGVNENGKFYLLDMDSKELHLLADYEDAIGSSVGSDCRYGAGKSTLYYKDVFYFITTLYNRSVIYALHQDGHITPVYEAEGSVDAMEILNDTIYFSGMQDMKLQELYACDLKGENRRQISVHNETYVQTKDIRPCVPVTFGNDGITLYGWVLEPRNYDPSKSYPAILDIHGGPKTVYGEVFYHEMQLWANMGCFVFFMNPRGGDGRGNTFADLRGKYGTIDYDDLMKFTDVVLERYPAIDQNRVGVTGGSYGGFMTNWIIGHTQRFKAAASQRSIANWISFAHTSDIGETFGSDQQAGDTWKNPEKLWWHSPLKYADQCTTPTLFIHSDEDFRCPYSEGLQMYSALCEHGVEARLCMFKGENHELSRSGKPRHRIKRLEEITNWMQQHLK